MLSAFITSIRIYLTMMVITGVIYPLLIYGIGTSCFPTAASGSLIKKDGKIVGSALIAQKFSAPKYFYPRPSAGDYQTLPSGASNLGPTSRALQEAIAGRRALMGADAPVDLLTTSGSGLDPHISPAAARFQCERVGKTRGFDMKQTIKLRELVARHIERPQFGIFGQERVNVLLLNLALDEE